MSESTFPRTDGLLGPIYEEAGNGQRRMREALFLTFNVDLGFFETRLLGPVRSTGAAVTVVADSAVFDPDPRSVRAAGASYALGLAAMPGAFHPKITIIASAQQALIGIGSGNLTVGGWHANDEVLTTVTASREAGTPLLVQELTDFLGLLPAGVPISPLGVDGIRRTEAVLRELIAHSESLPTDHHLLHTLQRSLLEQLPKEPADTLEVAAPFHDPNGAALRALIARFRPNRVEILAQAGQAVMQPLALTSVAQEFGVDLAFVQPTDEILGSYPYRHGKVLTARQDRRVLWSLVGSPNASAAALLNPTPGGNCEVALLIGDAQSLMPRPVAGITDLTTLAHAIATGQDEDSGRVDAHLRFLEARSTGEGLLITVSAPAPYELDVEVSQFEWPPERYERIGAIPKGAHSAHLACSVTVGRVRLLDQIQFIAIPERVVARLHPISAGRPNRDASVAELFASQPLADAWYEALTRLLLTDSRPHHGTPVQNAGGDVDGSGGTWHTLDDPDVWAAYAQLAQHRLGLPIFNLAQGHPESRRVVGADLTRGTPAWDDRFDETDDEDAFEELTTAEEVDVGTGHGESKPASGRNHARFRTWLSQLAKQAATLAPLERLAAAQLVIAGSLAESWSSRDSEWFEPLGDATASLARNDWPAAVSSQAAAVGAVCLHRLHMAVPTSERGPVAVRFRAIADELRPLTSQALPEDVEQNLRLLHGAHILPLTAEELLDDLRYALDNTAGEALIRILQRLFPEALVAWRSPMELEIVCNDVLPTATAAKALEHATDFPSLAVRVSTERRGWALVARIPGRLTHVLAAAGLITYRTYDTTGLPNVSSVLTNTEIAQPRRLTLPPWTKPDVIDLEVLAAVAVNITTDRER